MSSVSWCNRVHTYLNINACPIVLIVSCSLNEWKSDSLRVTLWFHVAPEFLNDFSYWPPRNCAWPLVVAATKVMLGSSANQLEMVRVTTILVEVLCLIQDEASVLIDAYTQRLKKLCCDLAYETIQTKFCKNDSCDQQRAFSRNRFRKIIEERVVREEIQSLRRKNSNIHSSMPHSAMLIFFLGMFLFFYLWFGLG